MFNDPGALIKIYTNSIRLMILVQLSGGIKCTGNYMSSGFVALFILYFASVKLKLQIFLDRWYDYCEGIRQRNDLLLLVVNVQSTESSICKEINLELIKLIWTHGPQRRRRKNIDSGTRKTFFTIQNHQVASS